MTAGTDAQTVMIGIPKPCDKSYRCKIEDINKKVQLIQEELTKLQEQITSLQSGGSVGDNEKRTAIRLRINDTNNDIQLLENDRRVMQEKQQDTRRKNQSHAQNIQTKRGQLEYKSIDQLKEKIIELQNKLQKTNLSLQDEKNAIREIGALKQKIPMIKASIKEVEALEKNKPDTTAELERLQIDLEERALSIDAARKVKRGLQKELSDLTTAEQAQRTEKSSRMDEILKRREELEDERDRQTTILLEEQSRFNARVTEFRNYESEKKKQQAEKLRERKRHERFAIERQALLDEIAGCVVTDTGNDEGGQRIVQLYNYCYDNLERLGRGPVGSPTKKGQNAKKTGIEIGLICEFGTYGLELPETKEDYEHAVNVLEPLYSAHSSANAKVFAAVDQRKKMLIEKLAILEKQNEKMSSPSAKQTDI